MHHESFYGEGKIRQARKHITRKWAKYKYNLVTNMGEDGQRLTGSQAHIALCRKAASEGMVLLENSGLLPLKEHTTVALFGIGSVDHMRCGGGSGTVSCDWHVPCDQIKCVLAGNDVPMPLSFPEELKQALVEGRLHRRHLETCVKHILELFLKFD